MADRHDEERLGPAPPGLLSQSETMVEAETIVIGGGPAGSACAGQLMQAGREVILLDKQQFPRLKLCAGWITPQVLRDLDIDLDEYPHSLVAIKRINFHFRHFKLGVPTRQYSIRRYEFDQYLLERAGVPVYQHTARGIRQVRDHYVVDEMFRCRHLVGAGGTNCPVYHSLFKAINLRAKEAQIVCLEEEFAYPGREPACHLWFLEAGLTGYSWFVPKGGGMVNVGIGGKLANMRAKGQSIHDHWRHLTDKLERLGLIRDHNYQPKGYQYYLRSEKGPTQLDRAYLIGDAAGLATKDMGEGIGPAVESGMLAAESIVRGKPYSTASIGQYSLPGILAARLRRD